jgi:formylglycine-generating enzyme required for sulfatase activity/thiol-disulfide isomerase/thioredoxin
MTGDEGNHANGNRKSWPTAAQFNEAVQNLATSVADKELQRGTAELNPLGVPMPYAGNFADVYKVHCPDTGNTWAVKFFKREVRGLRERYRAISEHLIASQLPFMVDFRLLEDGVRIDGASYPVIKMRWIEGQNLNQFVGQAIGQRKRLLELLQLWVRLASRLQAAGIAHADLQHGNVLLVPHDEQGRLHVKLIDYDGMYVPALVDRPSGELGHPNYQHAGRVHGVYNAELDRFSHLAICCAIRCLSVAPAALWDRFNNQENLLFTAKDFAAPARSELFRELWTLPNADAHALVGHLLLATTRPLEQTPLLSELIQEGRVRPLTAAEEQHARAMLHPPADPAATLDFSPAPLEKQNPPAAPLRDIPAAAIKSSPVRRPVRWGSKLVLSASAAAAAAILLLGVWLSLRNSWLEKAARASASSAAKATEPSTGRDVATPAPEPNTPERQSDKPSESTGSDPLAPVTPVSVPGDVARAGPLQANLGKWANGGHSFDFAGQGKWIEHFQDTTATCNFEETRRTAELVEMYDASRDMGVQLSTSVMYLKQPGQIDYGPFGLGTWQSPPVGVSAQPRARWTGAGGKRFECDVAHYWTEFDNNQPQYAYRETSRSADYVEAIDEGRKVTVRISATSVESRSPQQPEFSKLASGSWQIAPDLNRLAGNSLPRQWPVGAPPPAVAPFTEAQARAHQEAWAKYLDVPLEWQNSLGMKFRLIPPGQFLMGAGAGEITEELQRAEEMVLTAERELRTAANAAFASAGDTTLKVNWQVIRMTSATVQGTSQLEMQGDGSLRSKGTVAPQEEYHLLADLPAGTTAIRLETLADDGLPFRGPGTAFNGNFVLTDFDVKRMTSAGKESDVPIDRAAADFAPPPYVIAAAHDDDPQSGWSVGTLFGSDHEAVLQLTSPLTLAGNEHVRITLAFKSVWPQHNIGKPRLSATTDKNPLDRWRPTALQALWDDYNKTRASTGKEKLIAYYRDQTTELRPLRDKFESLTRQRDQVGSELPQHRVQLTQPFYLGVYEVTQQEFMAVMPHNPSWHATTGPHADRREMMKGVDAARYPVEGQNWYDGVNFCTRLSRQEKLQPFFTRVGKPETAGAGYRLPTEAEWEFACRAGTTSPYSSGDANSLAAVAFSKTNADWKAHPVGQLKSNAFGLYDMHGNVWEWCQDVWDKAAYAPFVKSTAIDPSGPALASHQRVCRGGDWAETAPFCRSATRNVLGSSHVNDIGFRLALSVEAAKEAPKKETVSVPMPSVRPPAASSLPQLTFIDLELTDANRYAVPAEADATLLANYIEQVQAYRPMTAEARAIHAKNANRMISIAAERILKLEQDVRAAPFRIATRAKLSEKLRKLATAKTVDRQEFVKQLAAFIQQGEFRDDDRFLARRALSALEAVDVPVALEMCATLATLFEGSADSEIRKKADWYHGAARRLQLPGMPLELKTKRIDGSPFDLTDLQGKVVLVFFWTTWCGPCTLEIPKLKALHEEYHDQGFEIVALSLDRNRQDLERYLAANALPFPVLHDQEKGEEHPAALHYGVPGYPSGFLIGRDGNVLDTHASHALPLEKLLAEQFPSSTSTAGGTSTPKKKRLRINP